MKKYKNYIMLFLFLLIICVSICFVPIDATRFVPQVEKQFEQELGLKIHIEKLIFRFGPSLKIKAPLMHIMYEDGQKFGQLDNVKFFVPWSTLFKNDVYVKRIYADKFIVKINSNDKYFEKLIDKLNSKEYNMYPNILFKNYNILYNDSEQNKVYQVKGANLELTKLENYKNLKLVADGDFCINDKKYISYNLHIVPNISMKENPNKTVDLKNFINQIENLDFHSDIIADLKLYNDFEGNVQVSGLLNIDNISVLDFEKKNPKSFIYLTFLGNKIGILSNIYAASDKKIYAQGVINNSKKPELDLKVKVDEIKLSDIYTKLKLFIDLSKYNCLNSIDGTMIADFNIKGDLKKLKSSGYLKVNNAAIKSGNLQIKNINSDIDFSNNIITIKNATGYVNSAPIILKGTINKELYLELLMDKVELSNLLPDKYGIKKGVISLNANISGSADNIIHKENIKIDNFSALMKGTKVSFDSLRVDTNKDNIAYISNIIIKPILTENIKLPLLKLIIDEEKIKIPETNVFMANSKLMLKAEISDYSTSNFIFNSSLYGNINSKDLSGITNISEIYPVKLNINGTKEIQNIDAQVQVLKASLLDEPSLININTRLEDNNLKIDDISICAYNGNINTVTKSNISMNKKVIVSGNIENIKKPAFKNVRIFIPQLVKLNVYGNNTQLKGDIFINGLVEKPEIVGQILMQNLIVQCLQMSVNNIIVDFNKSVAVINAPNVKIGDMVAGINTTISTDFSKLLNVNNISIKSKYFDIDTVLMYKDKILSSFPVKIKDGKIYAERVSGTMYNCPFYLTAFNSDFSINNKILSLTNLSSELYNGKMAGNMEFNLKDESYKANIQGRGVSALPIFEIITEKKDALSGNMDFDILLNGNLLSKQSLSGNVKFIIHNGHMGTLGKLEHLLYAQNVIADNMLRTSLSVVTKAITLKDTGLFKYLKSDVTLKDGIANINFLQSQGPLMSLYVKGRYNPVTDYAKLTVLGRLSDEIISGLGTFGEFSLNKLMIMLTGEENKYNIQIEDIEKLPQLPMRNTKEFRTIINGTLEKPSSVMQFNWISYSQKSLKQPEAQVSDEKIPDFIQQLPY